MAVIVTLSGGKGSAFSAKLAIEKYGRENVILYFNDTKWEHPDLYRFLHELQEYFGLQIYYDNDGRSPEELFVDNRALANNRMPFCSRILKAERLQKFYNDGDTIVFGIGIDELHRAKRLVAVYQKVYAKTGKFCKLRFPLIEENVKKHEIDIWLSSIGIEEPILYRLGFLHNNCSGGCVRAGKKHWKLLYEKLPHVYMDRERVEKKIKKNA